MADLDPAHVEAVAGCLVSDHDCYHCLTHEDWSIPVEGGPCQTGREQAKKMLTSTDPAVHAALLAAVAPLIEERVREARAEAWDDGFNAATDAVPEDVWFGPWSRTRNPYREEVRDA